MQGVNQEEHGGRWALRADQVLAIKGLALYLSALVPIGAIDPM